MIIVASALLAAPSPAVAGAQFSSQLIEAADGDVQPELLAANDRGDRIAVYRTAGDTLRVAFAPASGQFGPPQDIGESVSGRDVQAAVGPSGDAMIAWRYFDRSLISQHADLDPECCNGVKIALLPRGRTIGASATPWPVGTHVRFPRIAIRNRREFGVVAEITRLEDLQTGEEEQLGIQARMSTRRGGWGPVEQVAEDGSAQGLAITAAGTRVVTEASRVVSEHLRSRGGRWGQARRLLAPSSRFGYALDPAGGLIVASMQSDRGEVKLALGTVRSGGRPRLRVVDRASRGAISFFEGGGLHVAPDGTALYTLRIGDQWYRSERRAGRGFSARQIAFLQTDESAPYSFAVSSAGRWLTGVLAGGRYPGDNHRLRMRTARFGGPVSGSLLVTLNQAFFRTVPPVIDHAGRITFVTATGRSLVAWTGR